MGISVGYIHTYIIVSPNQFYVIEAAHSNPDYPYNKLTLTSLPPQASVKVKCLSINAHSGV